MDPRLVQSQPASVGNGSEINYHWICFFDWCEDNPSPFYIHVWEATVGYIPETWFTKPLNDDCRQQKASFKPFGKKVLSVFAKIEFGKNLN